jgi:hypothetical protein
MKATGCFILCLVFVFKLHAQNNIPNKLNYNRLNGLALNQDIHTLLQEMNAVGELSEEDKRFKTKFEDRFKYAFDRTEYLQRKDTALNPINRIYQNYWRKSLLDHSTKSDKALEGQLLEFFKKENSLHNFTTNKIKSKTIGRVYDDYIKGKGYHSTGYGKTGSLSDFLVWKSELDTTYRVSLIEDTVLVNVHFMSGFISLGWEEYATMGRYYPGGWTTSTALFCVKDAYDLKSESFGVSYLSHEGQHFSDHIHFPQLVQRDLEYRAKLTELSYADKSIYLLIESFVNNARYDQENAHPFADYCVIRDLSKLIFHSDLEKDPEIWKKVPCAEINKAARQLFNLNTDQLNGKGKGVKSLIN